MGHSRLRNKAYVQSYYPDACIAEDYFRGKYRGLRVNHTAALRPLAASATQAWRLAAEQIEETQRQRMRNIR